MAKKLTILIITTPGWGHINACAGAVAALLARGHRIIFVIEESFRGKLAALGFEEHFYPTEKTPVNAGETFAADLEKNRVFGPATPCEKLVNVVAYLDGPQRLRDVREMNAGIRDAIEAHAPVDCILFDGNALLPEIHYSGVLWIRCFSSAPQYYVPDDSIPPGASGLPTNGDRSEWAAFRKVSQGVFHGKILNDSIESWGYSRFPHDARCPESQSLSVYAYPYELDHDAVRAKGWFNLEVFNKTQQKVTKLESIVPVAFLEDDLDGKFSGKLIYVSMGSLGSIDLELMKRLVEVLGRTNHKFIFAKGPRHAEFDLARNQWGERWLAQTEIVPQVDLVITHGGNNSLTETFAHGKPMIVLPNFWDQYDNAQRLHETGLGIRLDTYRFTDEELVEAVDKLLYNAQLNANLKLASERILTSDRHLEFALKVEQMFS